MKTFIVFLLVMFTFFASGQKNFTPGYVVLNSGDTIRGDIDFGNRPVNPESILFRSSASQQKYVVNQVKSFYAGGVIFSRFPVSYQQSATELADATEVFDAPEVSKVAWLKLLYKSTYSLYELATEKRKHYFVFSDNDGLKELIYRVRVSTSRTLEKDEQFKNLLLSYAIATGTEQSLQKKLFAAEYRSDDLLAVFELLNAGKNSFKANAQTKKLVDICAGGSFYSFTTSGALLNDGSGAYAIYSTDFRSSAGFIIGAGLTFVSKEGKGTVQSRIGLNLGSISINGENNSGEGSYRKEKYEGSLLIVQPNFSLEFSLTKNKASNIFLGMVFGYNLVAKNSLHSSFENPGIFVRKDDFPNSGGGFLSLGINASVSGTWGRLSLAGFWFSNILDYARKAGLHGNQIALTYHYFIKK